MNLKSNYKSKIEILFVNKPIHTRQIILYESGKYRVIRFELPASSYPILELPASGAGNSVAGNSSQSSTLNRIELPASGKLDGKNQA